MWSDCGLSLASGFQEFRPGPWNDALLAVAGSMASSSIAECLTNVSHYDPDNRYMAFSDLISHLTRGAAVDDRVEAQ